MLNPEDAQGIARSVEAWFRVSQRDLPWRRDRTPYRVWISEIMLQQTQVSKVIAYFNRFTARFRTLEQLASAEEDEVLSHWTGLGYYSRCRNLHNAAKKIVSDHGGEFPQTFEKINALPGIGSYTAGAISSFAFNQLAPVVDGNIARVLSRLYADHTPIDSQQGKKHFEGLSLNLAREATEPALFHEGLMEIGATVCKPRSPLCESCPIATYCQSRLQGISESLPSKGKKAARKELHGVFAVVGDEDHIWMERNNTNRLLKNLYAPPHLFVDNPEDVSGGLMQLSQQYGFPIPPAPVERKIVVRQLTHRIFHLHGHVVRASPQEIPNANWIKRADLSHIGLSSAILALLEKTRFLAFLIFFMAGCSHNRPQIRVKPWQPEQMPESVPEQQPKSDVHPWRQQVARIAKDAVGKKQISFKGRYFRRDCSGTVRGIFETAGLSLKDAQGKKRQSDTKTLYDFARSVGTILHKNPQVGDLVFFHNTYDVNRDGRMNDDFSHVGVISEILDDETPLFVHLSRGVIIESKMSDILRRHTRRQKGKTGWDLLAGFGSIIND